MLGKIYLLVEREPDGETGKTVYEREFTTRRNWFWIPFLYIETAGFILVFAFDSDKAIYRNYIPIDFTITWSMFIYYLLRYKDSREIKQINKNIEDKI